MIDLKVYINTLRLKGNLAYEYNPLYNYQTNIDLYKIKNFIFPADKAVNLKNGEILTKNGGKWTDKRGNIISKFADKNTTGVSIYAKAGSVIDLDTDKLNFDLEHPVDIEILPSYDGSVNLILNDNKNIPRIINSRFSTREKNTYEIVDRIGENNTNIYSSDTFDKDSSLYFLYGSNPTVEYKGFIKGVLPVGLYCFYFTYCDADENESDYIAETGLIPVFIGNNGNLDSIDGGIKNQSSDKGIRLKLSNIDSSYNYLKIYYVRYLADYQQNRVSECKKIYRKYPINSSIVYIQITGYEETEDIDANILNTTRFNPKSILTQALCKNMLFFGNIVKNSDNYKELSDCALRIIPEVSLENINIPSTLYGYSSIELGYYDAANMYNKVGYFNLEYYRFGVVFIYQNGTLSSVYNTLGGTLSRDKKLDLSGELFDTSNAFLIRNYIKIDDYGWIKSDDKYHLEGSNINSKGVCHISLNEIKETEVIGIKFNIPEDVITFLKNDLKIRGLFFVRLKCVPNILGLCYLLPMDELLEAPVIKYNDENNNIIYTTECFITQPDDKKFEGRTISNTYENRLYKYKYKENDPDSVLSTSTYAGICPDFLLNLPYYNLIFNGSKFKLEQIISDYPLKKTGRYYYTDNESQKSTNLRSLVTISTVTENVPTVAILDKAFRLEIGETEEAFRFKYAEIDNGTYDSGKEDFDAINKATNLVRGKYSPYLAIYSNTKLLTGALYNIYLDNDSNPVSEFQIRMDSAEPFYAISDRKNFEQITLNENRKKTITCYRGDCYINVFTHRLNRNFNDPTLPNNDEIIDKNTWKDNYKAENPEKWADISRSDLNAVLMGSWITFKVRSAMNYALRSLDHSYVSEEALMGAPRSYYPRSRMMYRGENKMPDSYLYNDAYRASLGFKCYFTNINTNYIKDTFSNRIQYSAIAIQDSFKNNYRYSLSTYFRDYSLEYGNILKLIGFEGYLLVIFEHGIGIAVVNERVLAGSSDGEPVFINTSNVLPEELTIITDTYGTQWPESVVKSENGFVYGVDTVAKKIWRVKDQTIEILSDFKVGEFLINNITLGERELYPTIGLKNVKTHYNNNKKDVMFTFYDDIHQDEENAWNLCYNELLGLFVTFYSWIPSYSANIDTQYFTFDRNTSKWLSLLSKCNYSIPENTGVVVDNPVMSVDSNYTALLYYVQSDTKKFTILNEDGTTTEYEGLEGLKDLYILKDAKFKLEKDHWQNYKKYVSITEEGLLTLNLDEKTGNPLFLIDGKTAILLYVTPYLNNETILSTESIILTIDSIINNPLLLAEDKKNPALTTDFYLHGQAGIFDVAENLYPTYWYGKFHPFEFEFIVNEQIGYLKIFNNLIIISNKAEPESFHFEIEGDNYEFSSDKRTMYYRLESTKETYLNLGSDILFDRKYKDVEATKYTQELYYRGDRKASTNEDTLDSYNSYKHEYPVLNTRLVRSVKSNIFPLYYDRVDTYDDIYHKYIEMLGSGYDFKNLSGSEIVWNRKLNLFNIVTHIKNNPIDLVGRLRGNSRYKEGKWNIQIPSITFMQKNETWDDVPPIVINRLPSDIEDITEIPKNTLPNVYYNHNNWDKYVDVSEWTNRKETLIRDKWIKIRIRYSGKNLAVIHSLITLYNLSYS